MIVIVDYDTGTTLNVKKRLIIRLLTTNFQLILPSFWLRPV